jgi:hypothetical protein
VTWWHGTWTKVRVSSSVSLLTVLLFLPSRERISFQLVISWPASREREQDIGLNQTQVRVLALFQNTLLDFLGRETNRTVCHWRLYQSCQTRINGAKFRLERALLLIQKQLSTSINTYLGEDKLAAQELAHQCLSHSMLFMTRLSDYITRTSRALCVAGYKVDWVWAILSRQVLRIFEDMARARACAVHLAPPVSKQSSELPEDGEDYLAHNFEDHPSITAENVRFLTYNVMGAGGSDMDVEVKNLELLIKKMDTANKNLRSQVDKLTSRIEKMEKSNFGWHLAREGHCSSLRCQGQAEREL